jgi:hypothetical protein
LLLFFSSINKIQLNKNKLFSSIFSELAQKTQVEREAKRVLHEAGVAKKKEIISQSIAIKSDRQVNSNQRKNNENIYSDFLETY